jgi:hypothetical protein
MIVRPGQISVGEPTPNDGREERTLRRLKDHLQGIGVAFVFSGLVYLVLS